MRNDSAQIFQGEMARHTCCNCTPLRAGVRGRVGVRSLWRNQGGFVPVRDTDGSEGQDGSSQSSNRQKKKGGLTANFAGVLFPFFRVSPSCLYQRVSRGKTKTIPTWKKALLE